MFDRTGNILIVAILIGMLFGVVSVGIFGTSLTSVKFLGNIFLNALRMVVIPLLFCSMVVGIANLGDVRKLGRTGLKTILYFLATSSIAVVIGIFLVNVFQPGAGVSTFGASGPKPDISYSFFDWLVAQIPSNIIAAASETKVLPIIVFALIFGGVLTTLGNKGKPVIAVFEGINEAIMKIVHLIMWFAPIGIFGLVAGQLAAEGGLSRFTELLAALGKYSMVVILGLLLHAVIVLSSILKFMGGKNPIQYLIGMSQALMTAFATASSSATLPVSIDCVENKNDIDKRSSSFVLPLGATINMDGTALYEAVAAIFIAQAYGIDLNLLQQITIFATAILASVGAAGIPEAGLVTMVLVLQAVGLPLEGIGLILAIDWFLDRCRTTVNVWGDSIGAAVIATTAEIGLVDRRRKVVSKTPQRLPRRSRQEEHKTKPRKPAEKRPVAVAGKSDGIMSRFLRKEKYKKERDKPAPRKKPPVLEDRRSSSRFKMTESQDEYKPAKPRESFKTGSRPSQQPSVSRHDKTAEAGKTSQYQGRQPSRSKPTFGRRPSLSRSSRSSKPDESKTQKDADQQESGKNTAKPGAAGRGDFIVPKFPEKILEELTANKMKQEQMASPGAVTDEERTERDSETEAAKKPFPAETGGDKHSEEEKEDFSRLDHMVMGESGMEAEGDLTEKPPDETGMSATEERPPAPPLLPRAHTDEEIDDVSGVSAGKDAYSQEERLPAAETKADEMAPSSEDAKESAESAEGESKGSSEATEVSGDAANGKEPGDARMRYGRGKHRKPSR